MAIEKGKLVRWIDEKGFGFIKPENGGNDVFIHISSLKSSRKPIIGDTILYEINIDANGKLQAINAIIEGVSQSLTLTPISTQNKPAPPSTKASVTNTLTCFLL
jgi:cold shock CspA family protein